MDFSFNKEIKTNVNLGLLISVLINTREEKSKSDHKSRKRYCRSEAESNSDKYVLDNSDSDDGKCENCRCKRKYLVLRMRMEQVAM